MEIRVAHAAGDHPDANLTGSRIIEDERLDGDWMAGAGDDDGAHGHLQRR
jgi:hypothetical protein